MSRHRLHVANSFLSIVGCPGRDTKNPGRDLPHCYPCRDLKMMSRPPFSPTKQIRSRHQNGVATPLSFRPGRDLKFHVATSLLPSYSSPGCNTKKDLATATPLVQVATPTGRRDLTLSGPGRAHRASRPCPARLAPCLSRPQIWVATQRWNLAVAILASALHFFFKLLQ